METANISFDNFDFVANSEDKYNSTLEIIAEFLDNGLDDASLEVDDEKKLEELGMSVMLVLKLIENQLKNANQAFQTVDKSTNLKRFVLFDTLSP